MEMKKDPLQTTTPTMRPHRREKENIAQFLARKRDVFLIELSLATKKTEIQKLEEKAFLKEEALKKSEQMLEEDAMRFDAFLKENDRKAHEAIKRADQETKEKQDKVAEMKKLNAEIAKLENEQSKYEEQLQACLKYKHFLDSLTPKEWKANHQTQSENQEDDSMYFTRPEQLLDIFTALEERNLLIIQNLESTQEGLEDLQEQYKETEANFKQKTSVLERSIADLRSKIDAENVKALLLKQRAGGTNDTNKQGSLLSTLKSKVKEVYLRCGFEDSNSETLDMLRDIETLLEDLLRQVALLDPEKVREAEKKKSQERRDAMREQKKIEQKRAYEERMLKSVKRASEPAKKPQGKMIMFRSPPLRRKKKEKSVVVHDEEAEIIASFFK